MKQHILGSVLIIILLSVSGKAQDFWESGNGPRDGQFFSIALAANGALLVGTDGGGVFRSTDNGNTWVFSGIGGKRVVSFFVDANGNILAGTRFYGVYRSIDHGETWAYIDGSGFGLTDVQCMAVDSSGHIFVGVNLIAFYHNNYGIYRSTDNGTNWQEVFDPNISVEALVINPDNHFVAGARYGVYRSTSNGTNWQHIGLWNTRIKAIALRGAMPIPESIFAGTAAGIYRSIDHGSNWSQVNTGLGNLDVKLLGINSGGLVFAGTAGGIFRSSDNGENWEAANTGLANTVIRYLCIAPDDHLFAVTEGGVFRSGDHGNSWTPMVIILPNTLADFVVANINGDLPGELPASFVLEQNYPNPFNPSTHIGFRIADFPEGASGFVELSIYDLAGRRIETLVKRELPAGAHQVQWNAAGLPSGVYLYRLKAGEFIETRKMMLLR